MQKLRKTSRFPKVCTGCVTCKLRRVKCDEAKPHCHNCSKLGRVCGGYQVPKSIEFEVFLGDERRSYEYFREHVGPRITGLYGITFWTHLLPQLTHSQLAVKHALVSIGALYESLQYQAFQGFIPAKRAQAEQLRLFSMEQSSKAIGILTQKMLELPLETILSTCLLFVAISNLLSDWKGLFKHLMNGREIASHWINRRGNTAYSSTEQFVVLFLIRITVQYGLPGRCQTVPWPPANKPSTERLMSEFEIPDSIPDLAVAYTSLNHLMQYTEAIYGSQTGLLPHTSSIHVDLVPYLTRLLNRWARAMATLVKAMPKKFRPRQEQAVAQLTIQFLVTKLFVLTTPFDNEMIYDRYKSDFAAIILWAQRCVAAQKTFERMHDSLGHDWHLSVPLRAVAAHCRESTLRREAVRLLRASARPGDIRNNENTAEWMQRLIEIEEALVLEEDLPNGIPERYRVRFVRLRMYASHVELRGQEIAPLPIGTTTHVATFSKWPYTNHKFNLQHEILVPSGKIVEIERSLSTIPLDLAPRYRL